MHLTLRMFVLGGGSLAWALLASLEGHTSDRTRTLPPVVDSVFRHDRHTAFSCLDCHTMRSAHGALLVREVLDCRSCHHSPQRVADGCATCHAAGETTREVRPLERDLTLSVHEGAVRRSLPFDHGLHERRACVECHEEEGPSLAVPDLDCASCHEEHHDPTSRGCASCHRPAKEGAHTLEVHESCAGSGCHENPPFEASPPTRTGCLWCHEAQADHEPGENCRACHFVGEEDPRLLRLFHTQYLSAVPVRTTGGA